MKYDIAAIQMTASSQKKENLTKTIRLIRKAKTNGAKVISLPEVFLWRGEKEQQFQESETLQGPTFKTLKLLAKQLSIYLLAGSFLEQYTTTHSYNTSVLLGPQGKILGIYRKIHLFDVKVPGQIAIKESATKKAGNHIIARRTPLGIFGLSVCYDLRFPELYRKLSEKNADLIFVPSAFTAFTGKSHWETLLRARAIENQCYIIAPNQTGTNVYGYKDYGHSMIIDPWGTILAQASNKEGIIYASIDLEYLKKIRRELPALSHRKLT